MPVHAANPVVLASPASVSFSYTVGGANPAAQTVNVSADQPTGLASYTVAYAGPQGWLTIFPLNTSLPQAFTSTSPLALTLYCVPTGLSTGTYFATVTLTPTTATDPASILNFTVFLTVGGGNGGGNFSQTVAASPTSLAFTFQPGSAVPAAQVLSVTTSDSTSVTTSVTTNDIFQWLAVSPNVISTPGTLSVSVSPLSLPSGSYTGTVTITASNSVTQVPVTLTIGSVGLTAAPSSLTINEPQNYGLSAPQPLQVSSGTPVPISVSALLPEGFNWLQVDVNNATTPATVNVRANNSGLSQGTYTGSITIQSGPSNLVQVPVTLNVGIPAPLQLQPSSLAFVWQINDPLPQGQTAKINSLTGSAVPYTLASTTNDGGTWLSATTTLASTPGTVTVAVSPAALNPGTYSGFVNVTPTLTNASPQPVVVTLTVKPAPIPVIRSVTSAASYVTGAVAPGEIVTLFGSSIGPAALALPAAGTAPSTLSGFSIKFDGIPAPIYYVSSTQTTVQVPYGIASGQTSMVATYNGIPSVATTLASLPALPGLFTSDSSGQRQLAALNSDLSVNSAANPALRNTVLVLYGTGEGKTNPPVVEGQRVPVIQPYPQTQLPVSVTIAGFPATVQYAGETPGLLSGLFQINVLVPPNAPTGANIPVQVVVNGQPSQANVTVAIK